MFRMIPRGLGAALFTAYLALFATSAHAQSVTFGATGTNNGGSSGTTFLSVANQFTIGSSALTLSSVVASVQGGGATTAIARIYRDNSDTVGTLLATASVTAPANNVTANTFFDFTNGPLLTANTKYWLAIASNGSVSWRYTNSGTRTGLGGTVNDFYTFSQDGGATFAAPDNNATSTFDPQIFSVTGIVPSVAPEASTAGLVAIGLLPLIGVTAKRRR